jgi:flagellar basal-body rod protein FlgC
MTGVVDAFYLAGAGMRTQGDRLRVVAENIANADSTGLTPGSEPYRRKIITFKNVLDREMGIDKVTVASYGTDSSPYKKKYEPGHPAADASGYVLYPNVDMAVEMVDMQEAQRAYQADVSVIDTTRNMISQTLGLLK